MKDRRIIANPVLALPAIADLMALPEESRVALAAVLRDLRVVALELADKSWNTHKAPMAVYWKGVGVYAGHIARAMR